MTKYLDDTALAELVSKIKIGYQPKLTAGANITIDPTTNIISATGGATITSINGLVGGTLTSPLTITGGNAATASKIILDINGNITDTGTATLFGRSGTGSSLIVGHSSYAMIMRGSATRPVYNGNSLALASDISNLNSNKADKYDTYQSIVANSVTAPTGNFDNINSSLNNINENNADKSLDNVTYPSNTQGASMSGSADRVIETYISSNGAQWYRIWKSGWKECGGHTSVSENKSVTITLGLGFTNVGTMFCLVSNASGKTSNNAEGVMTIKPVNNAQVKITAGYLDPNTSSCYWYVCGY